MRPCPEKVALKQPGYIKPGAVGLIGSLLLLLASTSMAELVTALEPRLIDEMDTVRLTIRVGGSSQSDAPDLSPLAADFEVLGNQTSSRISSINGRTTATVEYQISLRPRHTGEIIVPRLKIGDDFSEAIRLMVRPLDPSLKKTISTMVFFETELSRNPVYVQAETVLIRRLYYSQGVQIYSDLPGLPEVENAVVIPLGETQSRSTMRDGQRYGVIEQRFALFPEQSGTVTIPSISVTSSVRLQSAGRTRRSGIRVSTEAMELDVRPIPADYPSNVPWLPATDVVLSQSWVPQDGTIEIGDPLTFALDVQAAGNRGSAIPPIPLPLPPDQFKIYPEAPLITEDTDSGTLLGQRRENYALIPTAPGLIAVPPVTLTWWDTNTDKLRTARTSVSELNVSGETAPTQTTEAADPTPGPGENVAQTEPSAESLQGNWRALALIFSAVIGLLLLVFAGSRFLKTHRPHLAGVSNPFARSPERLQLKNLTQAARHGDLEALRHALLDYLACAYQLPAAAALRRFREYPGARSQLAELDRLLYATGSLREAESQPYDSLTLATLAKAATDANAAQKKPAGLPALYA